MSWHDDYVAGLKTGTTPQGGQRLSWDEQYKAALRQEGVTTPMPTGTDWNTQYVAALRATR